MSGAIQSDPRHLMEITAIFYSNLYTIGLITEDVGGVRERRSTGTSANGLKEMSVMLDCPLSLQEISDALQELPSDICPRKDGLSPIFFRTL